MLPPRRYLNTLLQTLLVKYFIETDCILSITDSDQETIHSSTSPNIILEVTGNFEEDFVRVLENRCEVFVIRSTKVLEIFQKIEDVLKKSLNSTVRYNNRKYMILPTQTFDPEIFYMEALSFVLNFLVVREDGDEGYSLWTHDYVNVEDGPTFLDFWYFRNESFRLGTNLYPNKLEDQMGKPFRLCTISPFHLGTIELLFLREYIKRRNLTEKMVVFPPSVTDSAFDNFTGTGLKGLLLDDSADVATGYILTDYSNWRFYDTSNSLLPVGVTCLIPRPSLISSWYIVKYTFSIEVWILHIIIFLFCGFLMCYLQESDGKIYHQRGTSFFHVLGIFFQQYLINMRIIHWKQKALIAIISYYIFIFDAAFCSILSSVLIAPRYSDEINNLNDLFKSKLDWGNYNERVMKPIKDAHYKDYKEMIDRYLIINQTEIEKRVLSNNFALVIGRVLIDLRINSQFSTEVIKFMISKYRVMKDDLYWKYGVMMMRKNCVFLNSINQMILRIFQAGINQHWATMVSLQNKGLERILKTANNVGTETSGLTLTEVMDTFLILGIGYVTAIIAFIFEHLYKAKTITIS